MKKLLSIITLIFALTLSLGIFTACGETENGGDNVNVTPPHTHVYENGICSCGEKEPSKKLEFELNTQGTEYVLSGAGYCNDEIVIIPSEYNGKPVVAIKDNAFFKDRFIIAVEIPDSVTSIGSYAFSGCSSLTSVVIPDSVISIGNFAFDYCTSLTSVTIGNSVTSIGEYAFYNCSSLTSIEIPNSVTSIGSFAFSYCSSLTSVVIPNSVTSIGSFAFRYCSSLTSVVIPDSVTSIGDYAFSSCVSLTTIKYCGTEAQWQAISKGSYWNYYTGNYTITYNYKE